MIVFQHPKICLRARSFCIALAGVNHRRKRLIATKCRFPIGFGMTHKPGPHEWGLSRKAIMTACEGSLRRLKTDVIDLYQVHIQDRNVAVDETLRALDDLVLL